MKRLFLAAVLYVSTSATAMADYIVVVNASNSASVSMDDVKKIYMGQVGSFPDGSNALPIMLQEGAPARDVFTKSVLKRSPSQYMAHWAKMHFTGNGTPPKEVETLDEVKALIVKNPSAIGFIDGRDIDDSLKVIGTFN